MGIQIVSPELELDLDDDLGMDMDDGIGNEEEEELIDPSSWPPNTTSTIPSGCTSRRSARCAC